MGVPPIERVLGGDRLAELLVHLRQLVEDTEVRQLGKAAHPSGVQEHGLERRVARALALAKQRPIDRRAAGLERGEAVGNDEVRVVVGVELELLRGYPGLAK